MNHPSPDELLLFATGELAELRLVEVASHLASCAKCQDALARLEASLVTLGRGMRSAGRGRELNRPVVWGVALSAAAVLGLALLRQPGGDSAHRRPGGGWSPTRTWSATAGYMAGGTTLMDIDAQLTRLEQERYYGRP